jgi:hypothetical protein
MVALGSSGSEILVHVAVLTGTAHPNGGTKRQSDYGIPSNSPNSYVLQTLAAIYKYNMKYLPEENNQCANWQDKKDFKMESTNLNRLIEDTLHYRPSSK